MANNRLYIGNKETRESFCISKPGDNDMWAGITEREIDGINNILQTDFIWNYRTELVFFNESDNEWWNYFFNEGPVPKGVLPTD